jgi:hypothetical protein
LHCGMRHLIILAIAVPASVFAQSSGTCAAPFSAPATPGREISMNLRAGDITIAGSDAPMLRVTCELRSDPGRVHIRFAADHLTINGGPNNDAHFRIEIPHSMNLFIRCTAGNLTLENVTGDKDVKLSAGNLTISVGDAGTYRHAEGSVLAGNILASPFGEMRDGLFRSFRRDNPGGRWRLRAELLAGNLTLR